MRQQYLIQNLRKLGHLVSCYQTPDTALPETDSLEEAMAESDLIIGPVPFSKDSEIINGSSAPLTALLSLLHKDQLLIGGSIPPFITEACRKKEILTYDYMQSEALALFNAEITAEGMLCELLKNTPFILQNTPVLILGYGRCGAALAHKLDALHAKVTVCDTSCTRRELGNSLGLTPLAPDELEQVLPDFLVIINTVPALILTRERIRLLMPDCYLFDLASAPGGIDWEAAKECHIPSFPCLGLPGKTAPATAGEAIVRDVLSFLKSQSLYG